MNKKNLLWVMTVTVATVLLCSVLSLGAEPLTIDEYNSMDDDGTLVGSRGACAVDDLGNFYIMYGKVVDGVMRKYLNILKPDGNTLVSTHHLIPVINETVFSGNVVNNSFVIRKGGVVVPFVGEGTEGFGVVWGLFFDTEGNLTDSVCVNCDMTDQEGLYYNEVKCSSNNSGQTLFIWGAEDHYGSDNDRIFMRIYDTNTRQLSPVVDPMPLTFPLEGCSVKSEDHRLYNRRVDAQIFDDGSFAVSWIFYSYLESPSYIRLLYVVYNSDMTPRSDVMIADCIAGYCDSAQCMGGYVQKFSMAAESSGDFYLAWTSSQPHIFAGSSIHIWMRGFNPDGSPKYDPIRVNDADSIYIGYDFTNMPNIRCDDNGNVVVGWCDMRHNDISYNGAKMFAQKVDPDGNLIGINYRINNQGTVPFGGNLALNNSKQMIFNYVQYDVGSEPEYNSYCQFMPYDSIGHFAPGDINNDMSADIADLVTFVNYSFKGESHCFWPRDLVDYNRDGTNGDIEDLVFLVNYMLRNGPPPPWVPDPGIRPDPGKFDAMQ